MLASAPGKVMLAGEYVVLHGEPCLVAACDRRVSIAGTRTVDAGKSASPNRLPFHPLPEEAQAARRRAEAELGSLDLEWFACTTPLYRGDQKLGLGSSSACAAAAAAAVHAQHGFEVQLPAVRRDILTHALEGHREVAPRGSGADVAAAVHGGVLRYARQGEAVELCSEHWPSGLHYRVIWTGTPVRTSGMVQRIFECSRQEPAAFDRLFGALRAAARSFIDAFSRAAPSEVLAATRAHHRAMQNLGEAASIPIVERRLAQVAELAASCGGAAKPSGAGGGDIALALFDNADAAAAFEARCRPSCEQEDRPSGEGLEILRTTLGAPGVLSPCAST